MPAKKKPAPLTLLERLEYLGCSEDELRAMSIVASYAAAKCFGDVPEWLQHDLDGIHETLQARGVTNWKRIAKAAATRMLDVEAMGVEVLNTVAERPAAPTTTKGKR